MIEAILHDSRTASEGLPIRRRSVGGWRSRVLRSPVELEPAALEVADANASPPYLFELDVAEGRRLLDEIQHDGVGPDAEIVDLAVPGGPNGSVPVRIVRPMDAVGELPVVLYLHGGGWVFGGKVTHDRLIREIAAGSRAAVVFADYHRSPEVRYPSHIEECWTVARWVVERGEAHDLDGSRVAVAGDGVGGNMAAALTLMATLCGGVELAAQALFYPVTDASFDTKSYHRFAEGYSLRRDEMRWFWDQYTIDERRRAEVTASPLRATLEQLSRVPRALVVTAEADVVRDEGEAYARRLRAAGVDVFAVRYDGVIHDFMTLNALRRTNAARAAVTQAGAFLRHALHTHEGGA